MFEPFRALPAHDRVGGRDKTANERTDPNWNELLQELPVLQTGAHLLTAPPRRALGAAAGVLRVVVAPVIRSCGRVCLGSS